MRPAGAPVPSIEGSRLEGIRQRHCPPADRPRPRRRSPPSPSSESSSGLSDADRMSSLDTSVPPPKFTTPPPSSRFTTPPPTLPNSSPSHGIRTLIGGRYPPPDFNFNSHGFDTSRTSFHSSEGRRNDERIRPDNSRHVPTTYASEGRNSRNSDDQDARIDSRILIGGRTSSSSDLGSSFRHRPVLKNPENGAASNSRFQRGYGRGTGIMLNDNGVTTVGKKMSGPYDLEDDLSSNMTAEDSFVTAENEESPDNNDSSLMDSEADFGRKYGQALKDVNRNYGIKEAPRPRYDSSSSGMDSAKVSSRHKKPSLLPTDDRVPMIELKSAPGILEEFKQQATTFAVSTQKPLTNIQKLRALKKSRLNTSSFSATSSQSAKEDGAGGAAVLHLPAAPVCKFAMVHHEGKRKICPVNTFSDLEDVNQGLAHIMRKKTVSNLASGKI